MAGDVATHPPTGATMTPQGQRLIAIYKDKL